ncbi:MAG TPA: hypothetical protein VMW38_02445, partial [Terriglobia bacterium]|nr:hypothetical protein [Terriglobia bacterium]
MRCLLLRNASTFSNSPEKGDRISAHDQRGGTVVPSSRDPPGIADALVSPCQAGARQSRLPAAIIFEPEVVSPKSPELAVKSMN